MIKKLLAVLLCVASVAQADTYYEKTTIKSPTSLSKTFDVLTYGALCNAAGDDVTAINAAFAAARAYLVAATQQSVAKVIFPPGKSCLTHGPINMTGFNTFGEQLIVEGNGVTILANSSFVGPVIDMMGSGYATINNLTVVAYLGTQTYGIQAGRKTTASAQQLQLNNVQAVGKFTKGACYFNATEVSNFTDLVCVNSTTSGAVFGLILDGMNHWNVTSSFVTVTATVDAITSMASNNFTSPQLGTYSSSGAAIWEGGIGQLTMTNCYAYNLAASAAVGAYLYTTADVPPYETNRLQTLDCHFEGSAPTALAYEFWITGPGSGGNFTATPNIRSLSYSDLDAWASTAVFGIDPAANITTVTLSNLSLNIPRQRNGVGVFDTPASYSVTGTNLYFGDNTLWNGLSTWQVRVNSNGTVSDSVATLRASAQITSTLVTGTAPLVVASTTNVPNLNGSLLNGKTFADPGPIGSGTPSTGAFTALTSSSGMALSSLATQATNTVLGNATSGTAAPSALAVATCSTSASALQWTTNTGFGCNTAVNAATLGGATMAAPGPIGSGTPSTGAFTTASTNGYRIGAPILQGAIPFVLPPSAFHAANGVVVIGQTPGSSATVTFGATSGSTTATFSAGTNLTGSSADVGRVITILDTTYKYFTVTTGTSSTLCTGTLSATLSGTGPFANNAVWLSGTFATTNTAGGDTVIKSSPLPRAVGNSYSYFPANSVTASNAAGWYWTNWDTTTHGTVYQETYTTGTPAVVASPTAWAVAGNSAVAQTSATYLTGPQLSLAGNSMGINGGLEWLWVSSANNTAGSKVSAPMFATVKVGQANVTGSTIIAVGGFASLMNRGVTNAQVSNVGNGGTSSLTTSATVPLVQAIDTTSAQTVGFAINLNSAVTDVNVLESYSLKLYPSP